MSMCLIIADDSGRGGQELALLQVIEAIAYNRQREHVDITVDILISNNRKEPANLLLVHRGGVAMRLQNRSLVSTARGFPAKNQGIGTVERDDVLGRLYVRRIRRDPSNATRVGFLERENCFAFAQSPTMIDAVCPQGAELQPLLVASDRPVFPPVSAYVLRQIPPKVSWLRVDIHLEGQTYDFLVKRRGHFWVDGAARVVEQILTEDLPTRGYLMPEAAGLFRDRILNQMVTPTAYDVVVFRPGVEGADTDIDGAPMTGDVFQARCGDKTSQSLAHLYVTRSPRFWIDLSYVDAGGEFRDDAPKGAEPVPHVLPGGVCKCR